MPRKYISKVKTPGDTTIYYIKDEEAREQIAQINQFNRYLGMAKVMPTSTSVTVVVDVDGTTEEITYSTTSTNPDTLLKSGDVVSVPNTTAEPYGQKEYIFTSNGSTSGWAELNTMQGILGQFAYVNKGTATFTPNVTKSGTVTAASATLAATARPATFSTTAVTGATAIKTVSSITTNANVITGGSYSKATAATVTVNSSATFSGTVPSVVTNVTGGGATKNASASLALYSVTGGQKIVTDVAVSSVTGTKATVGSMNVYGLAASNTKYMTGPESLDKKTATVLTSVTATTNANAFNATVAGEILTLTSAAGTVTTTTKSNAVVLSSTTGITNGTSSTATTYTVGKSGDATMTQPTVTLTVTSGTYKVSVPKDTHVISVAAITPTIEDVSVTVSGSAVTDDTVTITNTKTALTVAEANKVTVVSSVTTQNMYGTVSAYAGGSHTHTINDTIAVTGTEQTITVNPST